MGSRGQAHGTTSAGREALAQAVAIRLPGMLGTHPFGIWFDGARTAFRGRRQRGQACDLAYLTF